LKPKRKGLLGLEWKNLDLKFKLPANCEIYVSGIFILDKSIWPTGICNMVLVIDQDFLFKKP